MARQGRTRDASIGRHKMPASVRRTLIASITLLLTGALYLIAVRGQALLADLSALARFCF